MKFLKLRVAVGYNPVLELRLDLNKVHLDENITKTKGRSYSKVCVSFLMLLEGRAELDLLILDLLVPLSHN